MILRKLWYIFILLFCINCAGVSVKKIKLPNAPLMQPVVVQNKTITGKSVDNAITNHINLWKYIRELQKLGGFR